MAEYGVNFRRSADKDLRRLDAATERRVVRVIEELARQPRPAGCRKLVGSENAFRIRIGDYRVIYTVEDAVREIVIESVRHRREAYR
jgi:mRNA interferase RelE/StbE